jgi:hypothetical protein
MAVRPLGGARPRRAALGRALAAFVAAPAGRTLSLVGLYAAAAVVATADAIGSFGSSFIAGGAPGFGQPGAGDHLQTVYRFWLVGHQLEDGSAPWRDPYSFQPLADPQLTLAGWPFGLPFWPLEAAFGPVVAWNTLLLACVVVAGLATYGWLRQLGLPAAAAVIGGLAFAIAPYRLAQSAGHLLGWVAVLLPVALYAYERSRTASSRRAAHAWGFASFAALVSLPLSGQVHLAVGALPFALAYAVVRRRPAALGWIVAACVAGSAIGIALRETVIAGSVASGGRTIDQVEMFQASWLDLLSRFRHSGLEEFVYVGWLVPLVAAAGLALLWRRHRWLALLLGVAAVVPLVFALGTNTPVYEPIWRWFPPLHFTRVPGRLIPIAALALAALVAFGIAWLLARVAARRRMPTAAVALVLVAADLAVLPFGPTAADPGNAAYAAAGESPAERILELPLFEPGIHFGSVYHYYALERPHERPAGYSTLAPPSTYAFFWSMNRLNCGIWRPTDAATLQRLGVTRLLFHRGVYLQSGRPGAWFLWSALQEAGYRASARGGSVWLFPLVRRDGAAPQPPPVREPDRAAPVLCEGWRGFTMKERDAPMWVYGDADLELELAAPGRTRAVVWVDGERVERFVVDGTVTLSIPLEGDEWHSIVLEVPRLFEDAKPPQGLEITKMSFLPA